MKQDDGGSACFCGSGRTYAACCELLHRGGVAATAEMLMRSRYGAYVLGLEPYLLATWHPKTRPAALNLSAEAEVTRWLGLSVREHRLTGADSATVEFIARYKIGGGSAKRLHERSRFLHEQGRWYYLDGEFL